jgi:hypothetical protein
MQSSFCLWLADVEDGCWRMIKGVFRFAFHRLPEWVYRTLLDTVGPVTIRLIRVLVVFSLWLAVVIGPAIGVAKLNLPFWGVCATTWLVLAMIGSIWGRNRLTKKRRAAELIADADRPYLDGVSPRAEYGARY